jgi:hypothetical protein
VFALLRQGLIAGALAGLLAGLVAFVIGEPALQRAIDRENGVAVSATPSDHHTHTHGAASGMTHDSSAAAATPAHDHGSADEELVSRPWQRAGLFLASTLSGAAFGGMFAVVFGVRRRRRATEDPWRAALWLGAAAMLAWIVFPLILAPPNPPTVGDPSTITERTLAYLGAVAGGLSIAWLASRFVRAMPAGRPRWQPVVAAAVTIVGGLALLWAVVPSPVTPPEGFPADLLWRFRLASVGTQFTLWSVLTLGFAASVDRATRREREPLPAAQPAVS